MSGIYRRFEDMLTHRNVPKEKVNQSAKNMLWISGVYMLGLGFSIYKLSPTKNILNLINISSLKNGYSAIEHRANNLRYPLSMNPAQRGRLAISLLEFLPINFALAPMVLPLKVWLAVKLS